MAKLIRTKTSGSIRVGRPSRQSQIQQSRSDAMAIQYLLVTYPDQRGVLADGAGVGVTNHMLMLPSDEYTITLDGDGYQPPSQDVVLAGTSVVNPMVISFMPATTSAAKGAPTDAVKQPPAASRRKAKNA
jgi:hypothetical protein